MRKDIPIPQLECIDGDNYRLIEDYPVKFVMWFRDFQFNIEAGLVSDLASIPNPIRMLIDRASLGLIAPVIHDEMCNKLGRVTCYSGEILSLTRYRVNLIFLIVMLLDGIHPFRATIAFIGVCVGAPRWKVDER